MAESCVWCQLNSSDRRKEEEERQSKDSDDDDGEEEEVMLNQLSVENGEKHEKKTCFKVITKKITKGLKSVRLSFFCPIGFELK